MRGLIRTLCLLSLLVLTAGRSQQHPTSLEGALGAHQANASFVANGVIAQRPDTQLFTALGDLNLLSDSKFTSLSHPSFPRHSVRIKRSNWCDGTVQAYTGYIDIEARHLFFYFFESRSDPDKDDVIFWTNGGPGGSSSMGLLMELGPCRVTGPNQTEYNPYSWNEQANIFFIDQPISVGYSYADFGESVSTTEEAAKDVAAFVAIFFTYFTKFRGRPFHMAGESYGGHYIPIFASAIYDQNPGLIDAGMHPINLSSIMLGNGLTDVIAMMPSYYDMQCKHIAVPPPQGISKCVRMKQAVPRCDRWLKESCSKVFDLMDCRAALDFCLAEIVDPYIAAGHNPYDMTARCEGGHMDALCYPITKWIKEYLNRPDIRSTLGVDPAIGNYTFLSLKVQTAFLTTLDELSSPAQYYLAGLLERGVRTLIYVGANDYICNWVGNERMTLELEWTEQEQFKTKPLRSWNIGGKPAGLTSSAGPFTFATIYGAGHMAPYNAPAESLELVRRWLAGEDL